MNKMVNRIAIIVLMSLASYAGMAQKATVNQNSKTSNKTEMKTYVIERDIPNAGQLNAEQLKGISVKSCSVIKEMGPKIQWLHSYVAGDKIYCIYKAENEETLREHAKKGGFPANKITEVSAVISPATAN